MARKKLSMTVWQEIQRPKDLGHNKSKVARLLNLNRETVIKYCNENSSVENNSPTWVTKLDWKYIGEGLDRDVPKKILFEEQGLSVELPSYQAFCEYLRNHELTKPPEVTIKIHRTPGSSIEVDYSGDKVKILNSVTGEIYSAEIFVGAASYIIPDNCKTAVIKNNKDDWKINSTYLDMCTHYGIVVDPADPYSPRHKPNVGNAIALNQKDFFPRIRNRKFTSLIELNQTLKEWLLKKLQEEIRGCGQNRKFFYEQGKPLLRSLPESPYSIFYFKRAKVHPDCHFIHEKNYYSVPHQYVGKKVDIKFNEKEIHAYFETSKIAFHQVMRGAFHYSTNTAHYSEKKFVDMNYYIGLARKEADTFNISPTRQADLICLQVGLE